jgi:hypothetical protein
MTKTRSLDSALGPTGTQAGTPSALLEFGIQDDRTLIRYEHSGTQEEFIDHEETEWPLLTASELELDDFDYTAV